MKIAVAFFVVGILMIWGATRIPVEAVFGGMRYAGYGVGTILILVALYAFIFGFLLRPGDVN